MINPASPMILQCLDHVHRQHRRWRGIGLVALALLALVVWRSGGAGQVPAALNEIRTKALVLVDKEDHPRIDLRVAPNDSTHVVLMDREGLVRMSLNVLAQGGADIVLRDQEGLPRAALSVTPDGRPSLSFYDATGTTRVALGLGVDGQSRVMVYHPDGAVGGMIP
jgi:hypothetical protein